METSVKNRFCDIISGGKNFQINSKILMLFEDEEILFNKLDDLEMMLNNVGILDSCEHINAIREELYKFRINNMKLVVELNE